MDRVEGPIPCAAKVPTDQDVAYLGALHQVAWYGDGEKYWAPDFMGVFGPMGIVDHYTPVPNIEALAVAIGGNVVGTVLEPVEGLALRRRDVLTAPVATNLGATTAVLAEYAAASNDDGHFVVFDVPAARKQSAKFLGTLATTGTATLVAP